MQEQRVRNRLGHPPRGGQLRFHRSWTVWVSALVLTGCFNPGDPSPVGETEGASTGRTTGALTDASTTAPTATVGETTTPLTTSTTAGSVSDTGSETGSPACGATERCVPAIPKGWSDPTVLGEGACPPEYPELGGALNTSLEPGVPTCACNCGVQSVSCGLWLENEGLPFSPEESCVSPDFEDECLSAVVDATCSETRVDVPATPTWGDERVACSGAASGAECEDTGTCFPSEAGAVCITQDGEHTCPAGFGEATVYHQGFQDGRSCSACSCTAQGQACSIDVEICSLSFVDETLVSGGDCYQLNSGDGDGVSHQGFNIASNGTCQPAAGTGEVQGEISETGAVTVCCMD